MNEQQKPSNQSENPAITIFQIVKNTAGPFWYIVFIICGISIAMASIYDLEMLGQPKTLLSPSGIEITWFIIGIFSLGLGLSGAASHIGLIWNSDFNRNFRQQKRLLKSGAITKEQYQENLNKDNVRRNAERIRADFVVWVKNNRSGNINSQYSSVKNLVDLYEEIL